MDSSDILRLLNTDHYAPAELEQVNDLCRNYPMFNLAHMLRVRIKEALGYDKESDLKLAAVYSTDRKQLYQLVTEVVQPPQPELEEEKAPEEPTGIQFSDEPHQEADVIIEQHAPYAGPAPDDDLLELDDEATDDAFILDQDEEGSSEELSSETLIESVMKEEVDLEETGPESTDIPVIDSVERKQNNGNNSHLISNFINEDPGPIRADQNASLKGDVSLASIREHDGFITDTLAKIYVKQGLYAKAIYAYERLSLKYPEKSAYFAAQIEKIKNINHS